MASLFLVGLFFHEIAVVAPLLLITYELTVARPFRWPRLALELTSTIPVVVPVMGDPVASGLVTTGGGSLDTFPTAQQIADLQGHGVSVTAAMGGLGNAKGAFHIVQVPGSYNIVNSNFIIQLTMIQVSQTALPKLKPFLPW